ncbi:MAG: hypothetical protein FD188_3155 [Ignavibacteria bacterium]|nr:MAG: hypothetical protein FD188_3155 [Ignavibacteria bacterium]
MCPYASTGLPRQRPAEAQLYRGNRSIILTSIQRRVLELTDEGHCGIVKTKQRCREWMWWPGIEHSIEYFMSKCPACTRLDKGKHAMAKLPIKPRPLHEKPFWKLDIDILSELNGGTNQER